MHTKTVEAIRFHSDRAMIELDRALGAQCVEAARAHFGLSALHLDRLRRLKHEHPVEGTLPHA